uniref:Uncharacterized protein n=1 Tax=Romanomermis culicivorax TaxID=13658 RepID=A0A915L6W4_ROMCU
MEMKVEEIQIHETDYTLNPHREFHLYSHLLGNIEFQNCFPFPAPIYTYPLPTTASAHALTAYELLDQPTLPAAPQLSDDELLQMLILDLNITKLPATVATSSLTIPPATADLKVLVTSINYFFELMLGHISSLAPVSVEMSMPTHLNQNGYQS